MSEYTQVDLQIGTEAQFETKKADLSEGVIVGLTDPIHENELDSALQTKIDSIKKMYLHNITINIPSLNSQYGSSLYISIVTSKTTAYDTASFQTEVAKENNLTFLARVFANIGSSSPVYGVIAFQIFYPGSELYKCGTEGNIPYMHNGTVNLVDMHTEYEDYSITADTVIEL